jgi:glutathione S-transferase
MKLFGHDTSPYVRRVRALLLELGVPFERDKGDWLKPSPEFLRVSPIGRLPVLVVQQDGSDLPLFDSTTIADYLLSHAPSGNRAAEGETQLQRVLFHPLHHYQDENVLKTIDAALDSAIAVFIFERDGLARAKAPYLLRQEARVKTCLTWLDERYEKRTTLHENAFGFVDLALFCCLDWLAFRTFYDFNAHANLASFFEQNRSRASFVATDPRLPS